MRKTKKWYKEQVNAGIVSAVRVLPEIIKKYGDSYGRGARRIRLSSPSSWWNCYIEEFYTRKNKLFIDVYWQGDSTDGNECAQLLPGQTNITIPSETYWDGYRTRTVHGDLRIDSSTLYDAIKRMVATI